MNKLYPERPPIMGNQAALGLGVQHGATIRKSEKALQDFVQEAMVVTMEKHVVSKFCQNFVNVFAEAGAEKVTLWSIHNHLTSN